jgi:hypothetical protein
MNPKFIDEIYEELDPTLTVFDDTNRNIKVGFNGSCQQSSYNYWMEQPEEFLWNNWEQNDYDDICWQFKFLSSDSPPTILSLQLAFLSFIPNISYRPNII